MPVSTLAFGIMTAPFRITGTERDTFPSEPRLCRDLCSAAPSLGIDAYVFSAPSYDAQTGGLQGLRYSQGSWKLQSVPLPDIVYNRAFYQSGSDRSNGAYVLSMLHARKAHQTINSRLPAKYNVYEQLAEDNALRPYLPLTLRYSYEKMKELMRETDNGIILKPTAGMQGKGILHLEKELWGSGLTATGRTRSNQPFFRSFRDGASLALWLNRFIGNAPYLIQPYLRLSDAENRPYDIRVLLQKDGSGKWKETGNAARMGTAGALTSNLHGGGTALSSTAMLSVNLGKSKAERLLRQIHTISGHTAARLEQCFGRFGELALDFGIEPDGRLWLLEANAKPGREVFRLIGDKRTQRLTIERPLLYAKYLTNRLLPTFIAYESAFDPIQPQY